MPASIPQPIALTDDKNHSQHLIGVEHGALSALAGHLPEVNTLIETSFEQISTDFLTLSRLIAQQKTVIDTEKTSLSVEAVTHYESIQKEMQQTIASVVMGLQFQDRVSQNLVITINVLNALLNDWPEGSTTDEEDIAFATHVLEMMKLGEVRSRYLDYLLQHQLIDSAEQLGYHKPDDAPPPNEDEIDLF